MDHDPRAWLEDVIGAIDHIASFVQGRRLEDYGADIMFRSAVERQLEIAGEALVQFTRETPALAARIPDIRAAIGMRNAIVHRYRRIENEAVWHTAHEDLPVLRRQIVTLPDELNSGAAQ
jgi:uncharacterized protein with HEPN domain